MSSPPLQNILTHNNYFGLRRIWLVTEEAYHKYSPTPPLLSRHTPDALFMHSH